MKSISAMAFPRSLVFGVATAHAQKVPLNVAALYKSNCAMCHGADGSGKTAAGSQLGVRSFRAPEVVKTSDLELLTITKQGKQKMPAYGKKLTDDQIKELIKYIRVLK